MNNLLDELEYQQMLGRERAVVQSLHDRGICLGTEGCIVCKEERVYKLSDLDMTLEQRGAKYGDYGNMAYVAQKIKDALQEGGAWARVNSAQRESLDVIATKMARIVCGDPDHPDSWHDIQGYAKLVEDRLPRQPPPAATP